MVKQKTDKTATMMRRTQVRAKSPSSLTSSICNHNKKKLTFGFSLSCFFHLSARQRLKFYCCQNLPCAASRGWSSPRRAQHLSSNKSFWPLFFLPHLSFRREPSTIFLCRQSEWRRRTGISLYRDCNCFTLLTRPTSHPSLFFPHFGQVSTAQGHCS